jgi:hypothetical protein
MATVILLSPVEGLQVGDEYDGPNAEFHVVNGYARYKDKRKKSFDPYAEPKAVEYDHSNDPEISQDSAHTAPADPQPISPETVPNSTPENRNTPEPEPVGDPTPTEQTTADAITDIPDPGVDPHA